MTVNSSIPESIWINELEKWCQENESLTYTTVGGSALAFLFGIGTVCSLRFNKQSRQPTAFQCLLSCFLSLFRVNFSIKAFNFKCKDRIRLSYVDSQNNIGNPPNYSPFKSYCLPGTVFHASETRSHLGYHTNSRVGTAVILVTFSFFLLGAACLGSCETLFYGSSLF